MLSLWISPSVASNTAMEATVRHRFVEELTGERELARDEVREQREVTMQTSEFKQIEGVKQKRGERKFLNCYREDETDYELQ
ncbi:hypothetical protein NMG60_11011878 [Bertholletia excelsa]